MGPKAAAIGTAGMGAVIVMVVGGLHSLGRGDQASTQAGPSPSASASASSAPAAPAGATPSATPSATPAVRWLSGASSDEAANGTYGDWRGEPIQIGGTWDNGNHEQVRMHSICQGGSWASWDKPLDVAIGAIDVDAGESWAAAAKGAYDRRWTKSLQRSKECWGERDPSKLFIRFAHEMNLPQKWRVRGGEEGDFVKAITRYSNLRYDILPGAKIVLCPNDGTDKTLAGLDIRKLWPGKDALGRPVADVYAVDSYNMSPHVNTVKNFRKKINAQYPDGVALGLEKHRQFAEQVGVPFAVGEWSNNGDPNAKFGGGDSPLYVDQFYAWARSHAGSLDDVRPGQLLYELHFNLFDQYAFWPKTVQPKTAAAYRALRWGQR